MTSVFVIMMYTLQAAERGHYEVAALLVAAKSDLVIARDRREQLALDLVKTQDGKWEILLKNS